MNGNIPLAYSRLRLVLAALNITVFRLHQRLGAAGFPVNIKSLYRLAAEEPLQKIDLRIAAAVCKICGVDFGDLITMEKPRAHLRQLDAKTQARLEHLMSRNNEGKLTAREKKEFAALAEKAHRISIENARILLAERRRNESTRRAKTQAIAA